MGLQSMTLPLDPQVPNNLKVFHLVLIFQEWWYMAVDENFNVFV
jgi:hypothetical protein